MQCLKTYPKIKENDIKKDTYNSKAENPLCCNGFSSRRSAVIAAKYAGI